MATKRKAATSASRRRSLGPSALNAVIDISHHNGSVDLDTASGAGILGVIQKATQGRAYVDPTLDENRRKAQAAGMMFGAYHFGTGSDGVFQAVHFLQTLRPAPTDLLVLDFEQNPQGPSMSLEEARAFVTHVRERTGRWPGIYSGHYIKELLRTTLDPILRNCWFWLSQYGPTPVVPPTWEQWTLWQYTDGGLGPEPHDVPGVGRCDRDLFHGTRAQLEELWGV